MIGKFIASRFSGYIALAGVAVILLLVAYIYNEGKNACVSDVANAQNENTIEVKKTTYTIKKTEQSMDDKAIDEGLCELGIARGNVGCD